MNIYVGNLSYRTTEDELRRTFEVYGAVSDASIIRDRESGQSKGFGFVEMPSDSEAEAAIAGLNDKEIGAVGCVSTRRARAKTAAIAAAAAAAAVLVAAVLRLDRAEKVATGAALRAGGIEAVPRAGGIGVVPRAETIAAGKARSAAEKASSAAFDSSGSKNAGICSGIFYWGLVLVSGRLRASAAGAAAGRSSTKRSKCLSGVRRLREQRWC